jgi:hypothetical protein
MKVALCFSGFPRYLERTVSFWKNSILDPYCADVFVHCWQTQNYQINWKTQQIIQRAYNPIILTMDSMPDFNVSGYTERIWPHRTSPQSVISQFTSVQRSQHLRRQWEIQQGFKYDVCIRARFDWFLASVDLEINDAINLAYTPTLAGHKFHFHGMGWDLVGVNDQFAYGNSDNMTLYGDLVDNIPFLYNYHKIDFCSELFVRAHLAYHNLPIKEHTWHNGIVRETHIMP